MAEFTNIKINDVQYDVKDANAARASALATKQDVISDLSVIRSGAGKGASSVQTVSVNGGTAQTPDGNGNVNIEVECGGLSKEDISVETQGDGTVEFNVKDDTYTINLNHTHENMAKLIVCEESDLPSTLDPATIYAQVDDADTPTEIQSLWIAGLEFAGGGGSSVEPTLPTGYVECEYVQSSDPTIIVTNIAPIGSKWMLDLEASPTSGNQILICSKDDGGLFAAVNSGGNFALGANNVLSSAAIRSEVWIEFITDGTIMKIGSDSTQRVNTSSPVQHHGDYVNLLGFNNSYKYVGKIYRIRCTKGGFFNGVPAKEVSSGDYGIYDLANGTFITGNFTGVVKQ